MTYQNSVAQKSLDGIEFQDLGALSLADIKDTLKTAPDCLCCLIYQIRLCDPNQSIDAIWARMPQKAQENGWQLEDMQIARQYYEAYRDSLPNYQILHAGDENPGRRLAHALIGSYLMKGAIGQLADSSQVITQLKTETQNCLANNGRIIQDSINTIVRGSTDAEDNIRAQQLLKRALDRKETQKEYVMQQLEQVDKQNAESQTKIDQAKKIGKECGYLPSLVTIPTIPASSVTDELRKKSTELAQQKQNCIISLNRGFTLSLENQRSIVEETRKYMSGFCALMNKISFGYFFKEGQARFRMATRQEENLVQQQANVTELLQPH